MTKVLREMDWELFRKQRLFLAEAQSLLEADGKPDAASELEGLHFFLQDLAQEGEKQGFVVPFLSAPDMPCDVCQDTGIVPDESGREASAGPDALGDGRKWCKCRLAHLAGKTAPHPGGST